MYLFFMKSKNSLKIKQLQYLWNPDMMIHFFKYLPTFIKIKLIHLLTNTNC